jgi:hypothetical protein
MRFFLDLKRQVSCHRAAAFANEVADKATKAIDAVGDWTPVEGRDLDNLVNDMVRQLPRDDADRFLRTVRFGFRSSELEAGLTLNVVVRRASSTTMTVRLRVRIFTLPELEAQLPTIGLDIANLLLRQLPDMRFAAMMIWKDRDRKPVLVGEGVPARTRRQAALGAGASFFLLIFGLCSTTLLLILAIRRPHETVVLESDSLDWFKRLAGPLLSLSVGGMIAVGLELRRPRYAFARWRVEGSFDAARKIAQPLRDGRLPRRRRVSVSDGGPGLVDADLPGAAA